MMRDIQGLGIISYQNSLPGGRHSHTPPAIHLCQLLPALFLEPTSTLPLEDLHQSWCDQAMESELSQVFDRCRLMASFQACSVNLGVKPGSWRS